MLDQKQALYEHVKKRVKEQEAVTSLVQALQSQVIEGEGEEESTIEVMMETGGNEMDTTIVEQGALPKANSSAEQQAYERLVSLEQDAIQFRFEALFYLDLIIRAYKQVRETQNEGRLLQDIYPRMWIYLVLMNLVVYIGPGHVTAKHRGHVSMDI